MVRWCSDPQHYLVIGCDDLTDEGITAVVADPGVKAWKFCLDSQMVDWDWGKGTLDIQRLSSVRRRRFIPGISLFKGIPRWRAHRWLSSLGLSSN